ncbi:MAG: PAS domain S-box protein, partial [Candidatus Thorarchaeota archaeon]
IMSTIKFTDNKFPNTEKALDHLVSNSMAGVVVIGEDKKVEYVNDIVCTTLGYTNDELLGTDFQEYLHPDSRDWVDSIYKERVSGNNKVRTYEAKVQSKDGRIVDVQVCSTSMASGQNNVKILAQVLDRSDVEHNRHALSWMEKKYQVLVETMNEGLGVIDANGKLIFANSTLCNLVGFEEEELLGISIGDLLVGLDLDTVIEKVIQRREGMKDRYETGIIHRTKKVIPVMVSSSPLFCENYNYSGSIAVFTDLSKVYESKQQLRQVFDAFSDPAFLWKRTLDNDIILDMINKPMLEHSRGAANEYIGKPLGAILERSPDLVNCVQQVFVDGQSFRLEAPFEGHPGPKRWFIWDFIRQSEDAVIMIAKDITHRIKSEKRLQEMNDRALFYLDLLQHDIRNKLQEIQGFTELAVDSLNGNMKTSSLNYVLSAVSKCTDLIAKTSALEKLMELPLTKQPLSEAIFNALKQFKNIDKIVNLKISGPQIQANELLEQMFSFLFENMCERNTSAKKRLWVKYSEREKYHEILLYCNGPTIPENEIPHLFNPLKRACGVELLIVQHIVERFNGKIVVANKSGDDQIFRTEFQILFPKI